MSSLGKRRFSNALSTDSRTASSPRMDRTPTSVFSPQQGLRPLSSGQGSPRVDFHHDGSVGGSDGFHYANYMVASTPSSPRAIKAVVHGPTPTSAPQNHLAPYPPHPAQDGPYSRVTMSPYVTAQLPFQSHVDHSPYRSSLNGNANYLNGQNGLAAPGGLSDKTTYISPESYQPNLTHHRPGPTEHHASPPYAYDAPYYGSDSGNGPDDVSSTSNDGSPKSMDRGSNHHRHRSGSSIAIPAGAVLMNGPRGGRACLACRKLKTRCEGAEHGPPCRRCKAGDHECLFVESKRGKRPPKRPVVGPDGTLMAVSSSGSRNSGEQGRPKSHMTALNQSQRSDSNDSRSNPFASPNDLKGHSLPHLSASSSGPPNAATSGPTTQEIERVTKLVTGVREFAEPDWETAKLKTGLDDHGSPSIVSEARLSSVSPEERRDETASQKAREALETISAASAIAAASRATKGLNATPNNERILDRSHSNPLNTLADASLAQELEGKSDISGLDPSFGLSALCEAIISKQGGHEVRTGSASPGSAPALLLKGIVSAGEAVELFKIYFERFHLLLPLIDPHISSATTVCARSPFLFTVICAIASRTHPTRRDLHRYCYDEAHALFVDAIANGVRNIDVVQACLLLSVWTSAPKDVENRPSRAWLYSGHAVRIAMELGLYKPITAARLHVALRKREPASPSGTSPTDGGAPHNPLEGMSESEQRQELNRERTWMMAYIIDRNVAAVMGRPYMIKDVTPYLLPRHPLCQPLDIGICAHLQLARIMGKVLDIFQDRILGYSGASDEMPSPIVMKLLNDELEEWKQKWCPKTGEPVADLLHFHYLNSKLHLNTFPLQTMLSTGGVLEDPGCVDVCIRVAKDLISLAIENMAALDLLRYGMDYYFLVVLYAAVFLIKLKASRSKFATALDDSLFDFLQRTMEVVKGSVTSEEHAAGTLVTNLRVLLANRRRVEASSAGLGTNDGIRSGARTPVASHAASHPLSHSNLSGALPRTRESSLTQAAPHEPGHKEGATGPGMSGVSEDPPLTASMSSTGMVTPCGPNDALSGTLDHFPALNTALPTDGMSFSGHELDQFLDASGFFNSILVSKGLDGFYNGLNMGPFDDLDVTGVMSGIGNV